MNDSYTARNISGKPETGKYLFHGRKTDYYFQTKCRKIYLEVQASKISDFSIQYPCQLKAETDTGKIIVLNDSVSRWQVRRIPGILFDPQSCVFDFKFRRLAILLYDFLYSYGIGCDLHTEVSQNYIDNLIEKMKKAVVGEITFVCNPETFDPEYKQFYEDAIQLREIVLNTIEKYGSIIDFSQKNNKLGDYWHAQSGFINDL